MKQTDKRAAIGIAADQAILDHIREGNDVGEPERLSERLAERILLALFPSPSDPLLDRLRGASGATVRCPKCQSSAVVGGNGRHRWIECQCGRHEWHEPLTTEAQAEVNAAYEKLVEENKDKPIRRPKP